MITSIIGPREPHDYRNLTSECRVQPNQKKTPQKKSWCTEVNVIPRTMMMVPTVLRAADADRCSSLLVSSKSWRRGRGGGDCMPHALFSSVVVR